MDAAEHKIVLNPVVRCQWIVRPPKGFAHKALPLYRIFKITQKSELQIHLEEMYEHYPNISRTEINAALVLTNNNVEEAKIMLELRINLECSHKKYRRTDDEPDPEPLNLSVQSRVVTQQQTRAISPKLKIISNTVITSSPWNTLQISKPPEGTNKINIDSAKHSIIEKPNKTLNQSETIKLEDEQTIRRLTNKNISSRTSDHVDQNSNVICTFKTNENFAQIEKSRLMKLQENNRSNNKFATKSYTTNDGANQKFKIETTNTNLPSNNHFLLVRSATDTKEPSVSLEKDFYFERPQTNVNTRKINLVATGSTTFSGEDPETESTFQSKNLKQTNNTLIQSQNNINLPNSTKNYRNLPYYTMPIINRINSSCGNSDLRLDNNNSEKKPSDLTISLSSSHPYKNSVQHQRNFTNNLNSSVAINQTIRLPHPASSSYEKTYPDNFAKNQLTLTTSKSISEDYNPIFFHKLSSEASSNILPHISQTEQAPYKDPLPIPPADLSNYEGARLFYRPGNIFVGSGSIQSDSNMTSSKTFTHPQCPPQKRLKGAQYPFNNNADLDVPYQIATDISLPSTSLGSKETTADYHRVRRYQYAFGSQNSYHLSQNTQKSDNTRNKTNKRGFSSTDLQLLRISDSSSSNKNIKGSSLEERSSISNPKSSDMGALKWSTLSVCNNSLHMLHNLSEIKDTIPPNLPNTNKKCLQNLSNRTTDSFHQNLPSPNLMHQESHPVTISNSGTCGGSSERRHSLTHRKPYDEISIKAKMRNLQLELEKSLVTFIKDGEIQRWSRMIEMEYSNAVKEITSNQNDAPDLPEIGLNETRCEKDTVTSRYNNGDRSSSQDESGGLASWSDENSDQASDTKLSSNDGQENTSSSSGSSRTVTVSLPSLSTSTQDMSFEFSNVNLILEDQDLHLERGTRESAKEFHPVIRNRMDRYQN